MKRFLILVIVFVSLFAFASCGGKKKEKPRFEEEITKEIKAEEGGTIESSDGKTSIEVSAGALDSDTVITMRIYNSSEYSFGEGEQVVTKVVEFQPSGLIFKKPLIITMPVENAFHKRILTAAVLKESENRWSYNEHGVYAVLAGREAGGDPIMLSAGGDPIMLNAGGDPIMMDAGGDPIMLAAAGDPIMLKAGGDPIMISSLGDPIMSAAMGDPIMMTTGHFTAFTFIALESAEYEPGDSDSEPARPDGNEPVDDSDTDTTEPDGDGPLDDTDFAEPDGDTEPADDDVISEPDPVYSKVLCTNSAICINDEEKQQILCPAEGEDFYGQDAQYAARKGCVPHRSYTAIPDPDDAENTFIKDNATGLTWWFTGSYGTFAELQNGCSISYGGIDDWRLPTPKEILTLADHGRIYGAASDPYYIYWMQGVEEGSEDEVAVHTSIESYQYFPYIGRVSYFGYIEALLICVSGDEYGKINPENYIENGDGTVFDSSTNLLWQKNFVKKETWKEALAYCENLEYAGFDDWRLPNKNELVTLIDYSKADEDVVSSFPGFTTEEFFLWSSTTTATQYDPVWSIEPDGHVLLMGKGDYWEPGSVRCVRSDLTEKPEIPDCDETGIAPCKDVNGTIWSSRFYPEIYAGYPHFYYWESDSTIGISVLPEMCRYLNESGSNKWRMPTIDEIRSIVTTDKLKTGGTCGVTTECSEESCFSEDDCTYDDSSQTLLYDYGIMYSGTLYGSEIWNLWAVNVKEGSLNETDYSISVSELVQRCVLDETLPDYKKTPWLDPETGLLWSDISPDWDHVTPAQQYCRALSQTDHEHWWRMPTLSELETLINEPEEEYADPYDLSGRYSVFGDISPLISSDYINDGSYYFIDFSNLMTSHDKDGWGRVRCVSEVPNPCRNDPCASVQHSTGCFAESAEEYSCECEEGYFWNDEECVNPCDADPCAVIDHSDGCIPNSLTEYTCTCEQDYFLKDSLCVNPCDVNTCGDVVHSDGCISNSATRYLCSCETGYFWTGESECREKVVFPYTDEFELTWSSLSANTMEWEDAGSYCDSLEEGGFSDWRLPTVDELRTLILNCEATQPDGACPASDPDNLGSSNNCRSCDSIDNNGGYYSKFGDGDNVVLWSSSLLSGNPNVYAWYVNFKDGSVYYKFKSNSYSVRCVRKDSQVLPSN